MAALPPPAPAIVRAALPGFVRVRKGPVGGSVWKGVIPGDGPGATGRPSYVYLPPGFTRRRRYPVAYLLHGMPGGPTSYVFSLRLASRADRLIERGLARPFLAVAPPAGPKRKRPGSYDGEWAGPWESYLVRSVVPWIDRHLPTFAAREARMLGGLSAGGYGAVDIALRHPGVFGTVESWSGYFRPFRDGPLAQASKAELAAHDPSRLARKEAALLRRLRVRFEVSTGIGHGPITPRLTRRFAARLRSLRLPCSLWIVPPGKHGPDYGDQLRHGLAFAFAG